MRPMPLLPASRACQLSAVPTPRGETRPTPVRATRRGSVFKAGSLLRLGRAVDLVLVPDVVLDVFHGLADVADLLGLLVRDLDPELLLEGHHQLHDVQGVGPQVLGEARLQGDLFFVDPELLDDDAFNLLCNCHRWFPPRSMVVGPGRARARPAVLTQRYLVSPWEPSLPNPSLPALHPPHRGERGSKPLSDKPS